MKKVQDHYFKKAKKEGYRARSVYKLQEIDNKYRILKKGARLVDLGAFPGSWSQYASKRVGNNGVILAIDLKKPVGLPENVRCMEGDVFEIDVGRILAAFGAPDGIMSDMAPATTGAKRVDHYRSIELAHQGLMLAQELVKPGGFYLCKVFDGPDLPEFRKFCSQTFSRVKVVKPKSSRAESVELFLLCQNRK